MNKDKEGRKFVYPDSFIKLLGYMRAYFHLPYRQTEGVVRKHTSNTLPSVPDYSNISRRINRLNIKTNDDDDGDKSNLQQWKDSVSYGQRRWIAETVFSCIKRMFGEYVTAIRFEKSNAISVVQ
jgi:hypothetical protein